MVSFEFDWQSADGLTLRGKCWLPEKSPPRALICLVHGFGEYYGRYNFFADFWNVRQIGVVAYDLRGHGISDGKRGYTPGYEALMNDLGSFLALVQEKFPGLPLFLYGHSMGGNLVANFSMRYPDTALQGVILTSPWFRLAKNPPLLNVLRVFFGKLVVKIFPAFRQTAALELRGLSRDLEVGKAYLRDKLIHNKMSAKLFLGVTQAGERALKHADGIPENTLLMHGTNDPITCLSASQRFAKQAGKKITTKWWENMRHELHNEIDKEKVLAFTAEWVTNILSK